MAGNYQSSEHFPGKFLEQIPLTESVGSFGGDNSIPRQIWAANASSHIVDPQPTPDLLTYLDEEAEARFQVTARKTLDQELSSFKVRQVNEMQITETAKIVEAIVQHIRVPEDFRDLEHDDNLAQLAASLPPYEDLHLNEEVFAQFKDLLTQAGKQT